MDGKLVAQGNRNWSSIISPILIGKGYDWGGNDYPYRHYIDEVKIYKNYLSNAQIKPNYIAGLDSLLSQVSISKEDYNQRLEALAGK